MNVEEFLPFFDKLSQEEKAYIKENAREITIPKGQIITRSEDNCLGVLLLNEGELKVSMMSDEGREVTLFVLKGGDTCVLSASCILSQISFDVFIEPTKECRAFLISARVFNEICRDNVYAENFLLKITAERFSCVMRAMEKILFMSFERRLAIFLTDEMKKAEKNEIKITHEEIAIKIGSVREVVSRNLKKLEQMGLISLGRGSIKILDKDALLDMRE